MKLEIGERAFKLLDEVSTSMRIRSHSVVIADLCMNYLHQKDFFEKERRELEPKEIILHFDTVIQLNNDRENEGA